MTTTGLFERIAQWRFGLCAACFCAFHVFLALDSKVVRVRLINSDDFKKERKDLVESQVNFEHKKSEKHPSL